MAVDWSVVDGGGWITVGGNSGGGSPRRRAVPLIEVVVGMG